MLTGGMQSIIAIAYFSFSLWLYILIPGNHAKSSGLYPINEDSQTQSNELELEWGNFKEPCIDLAFGEGIWALTCFLYGF